MFVSPDIYEVSYKDLFRYVDFNFSFFSKPGLIKKVGRPDHSEHALFGALVLKNLALNSSYRTVEAIISQDSELARLIGFNDRDTPALQALGHAKARIIALDSIPIDAHCKVPMKRR
ncbi:MAG: hypothetical protein ACTSRG_20350 [Candidatus Helarchaeota archaeon]